MGFGKGAVQERLFEENVHLQSSKSKGGSSSGGRLEGPLGNQRSSKCLAPVCRKGKQRQGRNGVNVNEDELFLLSTNYGRDPIGFLILHCR